MRRWPFGHVHSKSRAALRLIAAVPAKIYVPRPTQQLWLENTMLFTREHDSPHPVNAKTGQLLSPSLEAFVRLFCAGSELTCARSLA